MKVYVLMFHTTQGHSECSGVFRDSDTAKRKAESDSYYPVTNGWEYDDNDSYWHGSTDSERDWWAIEAFDIDLFD